MFFSIERGKISGFSKHLPICMATCRLCCGNIVVMYFFAAISEIAAKILRICCNFGKSWQETQHYRNSTAMCEHRLSVQIDLFIYYGQTKLCRFNVALCKDP